VLENGISDLWLLLIYESGSSFEFYHKDRIKPAEKY